MPVVTILSQTSCGIQDVVWERNERKEKCKGLQFPQVNARHKLP